jgi:hypothetical protein
VPEVEPLIRIMRELAIDIAAMCGRALFANVPIDRVHGEYSRRLHELVDETEAQALLAAGGSAEAVGAIERCIAGLDALKTELAEELAQAAGDDDPAS